MTTDDRLEVRRTIAAPAAEIFRLICDPWGHLAIDASGMLQDVEGSAVSGVGDTFLVHMNRESLGDIDWTTYDVTVHVTAFEPDRLLEWKIDGRLKPPVGHVYGYRLEPTDDGTVVTSFCDWSALDPHWRGVIAFPIISETNLKATLGILDRAVRHGYPGRG